MLLQDLENVQRLMADDRNQVEVKQDRMKETRSAGGAEKGHQGPHLFPGGDGLGVEIGGKEEETQEEKKDLATEKQDNVKEEQDQVDDPKDEDVHPRPRKKRRTEVEQLALWSHFV